MERTLQLLGGCVLILLAGCAPTYSVRDGVPTATLVSYMDNDSTGTTIRTFWTSTTEDGTCKDSTRLQSKRHAGSSFTSEPVMIAADKRFFVAASYGDARYAQGRRCTVMASFVPTAGRRYQVELQVRDEVRSCTMGIYDITSGAKERVPFEMPQHACWDTVVTANGRPTWTNVRVEVVPR